MANSEDKPEAYETIPVRLWAPGIPMPAPEALSGKGGQGSRRSLLSTGVSTPMLSVAQATFETMCLLADYKRKIRKDVRPVLELLDIHPEFIRLDWVSKAFERLMRMERAKRKHGRPKGSYKLNPAIVLGFVKGLQASGQARNDHHAVLILSRRGIFTYDQAAHGLRAAKRDARLRPLLLPPAHPTSVSAAEAAELLRKAITPNTGETLHYRLDPDGVARLITVTTEDGQERLYVPLPSSPEGSRNE